MYRQKVFTGTFSLLCKPCEKKKLRHQCAHTDQKLNFLSIKIKEEYSVYNLIHAFYHYFFSRPTQLAHIRSLVLNFSSPNEIIKVCKLI